MGELLAMALEMLAAEGAGAEAGGAAEGASAAGTAGRASKAQKAEAAFNALFKDNQVAAGGTGGGGNGGGPSGAPGGADDWKSKLKGLLDQLKNLGDGFGQAKKFIGEFDQKLETAADVTERFSKDGVSLAQNKLMPILRDILPENMGRIAEASKNLADAFLDRALELRGLSGDLAAAAANRKVELIHADLREAQRTGESGARLTDAYTELEVRLRDTINPIKDGINNLLATATEMLNVLYMFTNIPEAMELVGFTLNVISDLLSANPDKLIQHIEDLPERIAEAARRKINPFADDKKKLLEQIFQNAHKQIPILPGPQPLPKAGGAIGIGLFDR